MAVIHESVDLKGIACHKSDRVNRISLIRSTIVFASIWRKQGGALNSCQLIINLCCLAIFHFFLISKYVRRGVLSVVTFYSQSQGDALTSQRKKKQNFVARMAKVKPTTSFSKGD